jgi:large subunit ribosomal protein L15
MRLNELKPKVHSTKQKTRVGRGNGSGKGTYSTYGCKGAKSRSGGTKAKGFEGGQTPLYKRIPKFKGFKPLKKVDYILVNTEDLERTAAGSKELNLNEKFGGMVKVLGRGKINVSLVVKASKFSASARDKILKAKGNVEVI